MTSQLAGAKRCKQPFHRLKTNIQFGEQDALHVVAESSSHAGRGAGSASRRRSKCRRAGRGTRASRACSRGLSASLHHRIHFGQPRHVGRGFGQQHRAGARAGGRWPPASPAGGRGSTGETRCTRPPPRRSERPVWPAPPRRPRLLAWASAPRTRAHFLLPARRPRRTPRPPPPALASSAVESARAWFQSSHWLSRSGSERSDSAGRTSASRASRRMNAGPRTVGR